MPTKLHRNPARIATLPPAMLLAFVLPFAPTVHADELPLNQTVEVRVLGDQETILTFDAPQPGLLSVVIRGAGDVYAEATTADGMELPGGYSDQDLMGNPGAEQLAVAIEKPGRINLALGAFGDAVQCELIAGFIPTDMLANHDVDNRPDDAIPLPVGAALNDQLDPANGDRADVFAIHGGQGLIVVEVRAAEGDVELSGVWAPPNLAQAPANQNDDNGLPGILDQVADAFGLDNDNDDWDDVGMGMGGMGGMGMGGGFSPFHSDMDFNGDTGHEAFVMPIQPGQTQFVSVSSIDGQATNYTIRVIAVAAPNGLAQQPLQPQPAPQVAAADDDQANQPDTPRRPNRPPF